MLVDSLIPSAFLALALAHFVALLSPGQDFFLLAGHAVRYRLKGSAFICVGIALGNAVYIAVAITGWAGLRNNTELFTVIELLGAAYLIWIGLQLIRSKPQTIELTDQQASIPSAYKQLIMGFSSAVLNPKNALFYMSLMTTILGSNVTLQQQLFCGAWMFMMVLIWDLFIAVFIGQQRVRQMLDNRVHQLERGAGVVLIGFAVGIVA